MVDPDSAFSAGLLHDVGKIILVCFLDEEYKIFCEARANNNSTQDFDLEQEVLGFNHADIGSFLTEQWKIPHKLTEAIQQHHHVETPDADSALSCIVYMANFLAKKTFYEMDEKYKVGSPDQQVMEFLGIQEDDFDELQDLLRVEYAHSETFMQLVGM